MSKSKSKGKGKGNSSAHAPATPAKTNGSSKGGSKSPWIIIALVVVVAAVIYAVGRGNVGGQAGAATPTAEEAKYIGRYLPAGYAAPKVGEASTVSADTPMTPIQATANESGLSIPVAALTASRNVSFKYTRADGSVIPLIAYVKPSGTAFVGVSFCVPCSGEGQTLTADGTLTCDSCGTKRDPESGVGISGACKLYPLDELPVTLVGDNIVIQKAALEGWTVQPTDRKVG